MPLLGTLLVSLFSGLASFFAQFLARKVAVAAAAVTALGTITTALLVVFNGLVAPFAAAMFSTSYGQFLGLAFPPIAGSCVAAMASCWSACTLYAWQRKAVQLAVQA